MARKMKSLIAALMLVGGAGAAGTPAMAQSGGELHIYNWTDYTSSEMIKKFEAETGIKVTVDTYDSNETLLAKLKAGGGGYDIVVASNDFVPILIKSKLIQEVDPYKMDTYDNLTDVGKNRSWDPGSKYTIPYQWGTTSYVADTAIYKGPMNSLKELFEPAPELKGKIGMFGSPSEVMALVLVYMGKPQCNTNPADLKQAQAILEAQKPFVKLYNSDGIHDRMIAGETVMHQSWSGGSARARFGRPTVAYAFPKEGVVGWMDNVAVPTSATNVENAKKFMAFLMKPENIAMTSNEVVYQSAVKGVEKYLKPELADAPEFKVPEGEKIVFSEPCSEDAIRFYDRIWTKLRK
ncbi:spermidine/putrescine transport system substrate-binding protein [Arboricoccus pini]|uniref:Putrescine-binding periplasmic protein n=1 Tax=Arboricoccus pini TaxID=1963835 RepID=A0A212RJ79_9PROT|nr:extracellular solute-binding protein [Arboricoccus pini]SNB72478.1 spermidine/putrescine transport system substrate-binding protein [Arboricoccus pini]